MNAETIKLLIQKLQLQIRILQIHLQIVLLGQKRTVPNLDDPNKIIIHHAAGNLDFSGVNELHKQKWGFKSSLGWYVGYTYFIEFTGKVFQARKETEEGAHTKGYNKQSIGICLQGDGTQRDFTPAQYTSLKELVDRKMLEYKIPKIKLFGHQNFSQTLCPSTRLLNWILNF